MKKPISPIGHWRVSSVLLSVATLAGCASALASTTGTSSASSTPPTSAYIENPQPTTTTVSSNWSGSYYGGSYYGNGYSGGIYYSSASITHYQPRRYFFPPIPPPLGEPYIRNRTKSAGLSRSTIPLSLSDYVNEPFYSPLSPFLYEESISRRRQKMIDDYMSTKRTLIEELRSKVGSLEQSDPATREAQLAQFALEQAPRVMAAEATAYAIRDELTHWRLFSEAADWNEGREWRLGDDTRWESTLDEVKVLRGAAFYQDGLSPAQRRLLREYAMELEDSGAGPANDIRLDGRGPFFYFSPETARIRLPANLPPELSAKIATYTAQKMALKKELRDVLYHEDRRWLDSRRSAALRDLATRQAERFVALETLAEEIRRALAPLPNPARPPAPAQMLPAEIASRITKFMDSKSDYERLMNTRATELKREYPTSRVEFVKLDGGFGIQLVGNRSLRSEAAARVETAKAELVSFNTQQIATYKALAEEKQAIREAMVKSAGALAPMVTSRIVDLMLREYSSTLALQELWHQYRDYEVAVLQPGLSPEQRRLLFDAALVKLDQQLPHYTY